MERVLHLRKAKQGKEAIDLVQIVVPTPTPLEIAVSTFADATPENAHLTIEETDGKLIARYIFRMTYTSPKSGRSINVMAKGDTLPDGHDHTYNYYIQQLILTKEELAKEFSRIYFIERRARQEAFLFKAGKVKGGLADQTTNVRVSGKTQHEGAVDGADDADKMFFEGYGKTGGNL